MNKHKYFYHLSGTFSTFNVNPAKNVDAIHTVLKHYEGYIATLATRQLYDENGYPHWCVDEELRRELETRLITKILTFRVA